jgi:hypothetical protein
MPEDIQALAAQTGLDLGMVQKGLGAILSFLQGKLGDDAAASMMNAIPDAGGLLEAFQSAGSESSGGLLGSLASAAGKLLGGQASDVSDLLQKRTGLGLSMEPIQAFLPKALEFIRKYLPPELLGRILEQLPNIPGVELPKASS